MSDKEMEFRQTIKDDIFRRLSTVIDPELGRSITDLNMVVGIEVNPCEGKPTFSQLNSQLNKDPQPRSDPESQYQIQRPYYLVTVHIELTVPGCPLSDTIIAGIKNAVHTYTAAHLTVSTQVDTMSKEKLNDLVTELKEARQENPFHKKGVKTRIFAVASGKGGVGKSAVSANLAATFAAMGYSTAVIDADIYGFSLPRLFGISGSPTNLNGMLMPMEAWGVKLISIGMFAGSERAILWRGPRLQRSLEQFLSDVWWGQPDVLVIDLPPGTGDMTITVVQALPNAEMIVVTTPQPSASDIAVRAGLVSLQLPLRLAGVIENMSWYDYQGQRLEIFGQGGGQRVSRQLTHDLGYRVPLLAQLPLDPQIREKGESGRPAVLTEKGSLDNSPLAESFTSIVNQLMKRTQSEEVEQEDRQQRSGKGISQVDGQANANAKTNAKAKARSFPSQVEKTTASHRGA